MDTVFVLTLKDPTYNSTEIIGVFLDEEFAKHSRKNAERIMSDSAKDRGCWIQITEYAKDFLYRTALGD